jgi:hypothetical protein
MNIFHGKTFIEIPHKYTNFFSIRYRFFNGSAYFYLTVHVTACLSGMIRGIGG